jgi:hypothetical protein
MWRSFVLLGIAAATAACSPYDGDLGPTPFLCGPAEPRCPEDYECVQDPNTGAEVCTATGPIASDVDCADDSALEPNDSIQTASITVADQVRTLVLDSLAICPGNDRDTFAVALGTPNENLELIIEYASEGATVRGALLNANGISITSAQPVEGQARTLRGYAQNLPVATYYVEVAGPIAGGPATNNYKLTLLVTQ